MKNAIAIGVLFLMTGIFAPQNASAATPKGEEAQIKALEHQFAVAVNASTIARPIAVIYPEQIHLWARHPA